MTDAKRGQFIRVSIKEQKLYLIRKDRAAVRYSVSTSKYGIGNEEGSNKTPLGLHKIKSKIGRSAQLGSVFVRRRNTHKMYSKDQAGDLITSRILRLEGLDIGGNKGKGIDSFKRCIYIHGTQREELIGKPASHGCIRMKNRDVLELFNLVKKNTLVYIEQ